MLSCSVPNQTLITAWYRIDLKDSKRFAPTDVESIQMASRDLPGGAAFKIWTFAFYERPRPSKK